MSKKISFFLLMFLLVNKNYAAEHKVSMLSELHLLDRLHASKSPCIEHFAKITGIHVELGNKKLTQAEIQNLIKKSVDSYIAIIQNPILISKAPELTRGLEAILVPKTAWA